MSASRAATEWIGFKTIIIREFSRIVRIWGQTIVPPAVTATLYFIIFGNLIGRRVGQVGGYDYMQFIAPGLIMMTVITNSYGNVVSSFFGAKFGKHLEELLVITEAAEHMTARRCRCPTDRLASGCHVAACSRRSHWRRSP